jgi:hypothetical protein
LKSQCPQTRKLLSEYIDCVLDTREMNAVREHLHGCEDCRLEHETLISLIRQLGNLNTVKAPENFLNKVHDRLPDDSFLCKIKEFFPFTKIRMPLELAAFAMIAILILVFFNFLPSEKKDMIKYTADNNAQSIMEQGKLPAHTAENLRPAGQPLDTSSPDAQFIVKRIPIKLALSLTTVQEVVPIPSRSVSYGNSQTGNTDQGLDIWPSENDSTRKILPYEVNSKIDEIIKSVEGTLVYRDYKDETGYPAHLEAEIPALNYHRFISKLEMLGILKAAAPALPDGLEKNGVLIQIEFTSPE